MIVGIGCDLVDIRRVEAVLKRFGAKAKARLFTDQEREDAEKKPLIAASTYAKRFAAKEAFSKALGTGMAEGLTWQDVAVERDAKGKPFLKLSEKAWVLVEKKAHMEQKEKIQLDLSLSDEYPYAQAFVIISWNANNV
ncbi:MAG: holo-ACP synthase [Alphaproteobacteria bacterium]